MKFCENNGVRFLCIIFASVAVLTLTDGRSIKYTIRKGACPDGMYYEQSTSRCRKIPCGGSVVFTDLTRRCTNNFRGVKAHPKYKQYYYICKPRSVVFIKCPEDQIFNSTISHCAYPVNRKKTEKKLEDKLPDCKTNGRFPVASNCSIFYLCESNGKKLVRKLLQCPKNTVYSPNTQRCSCTHKCVPTEINPDDYFDDYDEETFPPCKRPGRFRSPTDCSLYYTCSAKTYGKFYQTRYRCPAGTLYDIEKEKCCNRNQVKCEYITIEDLIEEYIRTHKNNTTEENNESIEYTDFPQETTVTYDRENPTTPVAAPTTERKEQETTTTPEPTSTIKEKDAYYLTSSPYYPSDDEDSTISTRGIPESTTETQTILNSKTTEVSVTEPTTYLPFSTINIPSETESSEIGEYSDWTTTNAIFPATTTETQTTSDSKTTETETTDSLLFSTTTELPLQTDSTETAKDLETTTSDEMSRTTVTIAETTSKMPATPEPDSEEDLPLSSDAPFQISNKTTTSTGWSDDSPQNPTFADSESSEDSSEKPSTSESESTESEESSEEEPETIETTDATTNAHQDSSTTPPSTLPPESTDARTTQDYTTHPSSTERAESEELSETTLSSPGSSEVPTEPTIYSIDDSSTKASSTDATLSQISTTTISPDEYSAATYSTPQSSTETQEPKMETTPIFKETGETTMLSSESTELPVEATTYPIENLSTEEATKFTRLPQTSESTTITDEHSSPETTPVFNETLETTTFSPSQSPEHFAESTPQSTDSSSTVTLPTGTIPPEIDETSTPDDEYRSSTIDIHQPSTGTQEPTMETSPMFEATSETTLKVSESSPQPTESTMYPVDSSSMETLSTETSLPQIGEDTTPAGEYPSSTYSTYQSSTEAQQLSVETTPIFESTVATTLKSTESSDDTTYLENSSSTETLSSETMLPHISESTTPVEETTPIFEDTLETTSLPSQPTEIATESTTYPVQSPSTETSENIPSHVEETTTPTSEYPSSTHSTCQSSTEREQSSTEITPTFEETSETTLPPSASSELPTESTTYPTESLSTEISSTSNIFPGTDETTTPEAEYSSSTDTKWEPAVETTPTSTIALEATLTPSQHPEITTESTTYPIETSSTDPSSADTKIPQIGESTTEGEEKDSTIAPNVEYASTTEFISTRDYDTTMDDDERMTTEVEPEPSTVYDSSTALTVESSTTESNTPESAATESATTEPSTIKTTPTESSTTKYSTADSFTTGTADTELTTETATAKPTTTDSTTSVATTKPCNNSSLDFTGDKSVETLSIHISKPLKLLVHFAPKFNCNDCLKNGTSTITKENDKDGTKVIHFNF